MTPLPYGLGELKVALGVAGWRFTNGDWPAWRVVLEASTADDATLLMIQPTYFSSQVTVKVHGNSIDVSTVLDASQVMPQMARVAKGWVAGWHAAKDAMESGG